ncbi:nucleotide cyclase [Suillus ampliporus]|nr:nucleotide cyclase [Suillus ampliporus]
MWQILTAPSHRSERNVTRHQRYPQQEGIPQSFHAPCCREKGRDAICNIWTSKGSSHRDHCGFGKRNYTPTGNLCLVLTDIRNSTQLWDKNLSMTTALHVHNDLLLVHLLYCGGYAVKTESDSFISEGLDLLNCEEGRKVYDEHGNFLARGLSVRMGIHSGTPVYEPDLITGRMDYFGSAVNRTARICASATGGQIMCSANVVREIRASVFEAVRQMVLIPKGEIELKSLDVPELASLAYPSALLGRQDLDASGSHLSASPSSTTLDSPAGPDVHSTAAQSAGDRTASDDAFLER